jgi:hypothetical protein
MHTRAVLYGGVPTAVLAIVVGYLSSLPNILVLGVVAGVVTGYFSDSWGDEMKDGAAAGALAGCLVFLVLGAVAYAGPDFAGEYTYLFMLIAFYAVEGLVGAVLAVRVFGSAAARPS